jgi:MULE transposase domain
VPKRASIADTSLIVLQWELDQVKPASEQWFIGEPVFDKDGTIIIGFATDQMLEDALKYGHEGLVISDDTHGTTRQPLLLWTFHVVDEFGGHRPGAHFMMNSIKSSTIERGLRMYCNRLHAKAPIPWRPRVSMTDKCSAQQAAFRCVVQLLLH